MKVLYFLLSTHFLFDDFDQRASHARTLLPAALASVPFGFVLVRVRVARVIGVNANGKLATFFQKIDEIELDLRSQYRACQLFSGAVSERTTLEQKKLYSPDQGFWFGPRGAGIRRLTSRQKTWILGKNGSYTPVSTKIRKKIFGPDFFSVESQPNNHIKIIPAGGLVSGAVSE